ncbi:hypothetical protein KBZ20_14745 [Vulcanococcus limneticus Candia 3F8]|uniref:hypothetical protein n=1 Tax=Vulcanococcus limneticus TaxID=2170428 RepID=UPI000B981B53|nr:hypothetical protein [Vulcanococcus limneticus]MCP9793068.1 hypothetical protein [Vulcanococcus limneticus MW73D5]MCP9895031.1 hypothetical protein [Vulcanococcus limneticus Candia 3F8]MCP9898469.1 hypothetical protein [Vulcanococcus limneticus Candia 3B3]
MAQWEYRVIHINVDNNKAPQPPDPQAASQKLHGVLSPEFIAREFPEQYGTAAAQAPKHPAEQLQFFLNLLGKEGWEMVEASQVGQLLMFFFKRPLVPILPAAKVTTAADTTPGQA